MSTTLLPAPADAQEAEVSAEDQKMINTFARYNLKTEDREAQLVELKNKLENVKNAAEMLTRQAEEDELEGLCDDDDLGGDDEEGKKKAANANIHFNIGDIFTLVTMEEAETMLREQQKDLEQKIKDIEMALKPMKEEMMNTKALLYAKFGSTINLDAD